LLWTFSLEVAWFRSLTAAFRSTTDAFALMLSCVLLSLGVAARLAPALKKKGRSLGSLVSASGALILLATPLVERFDLVPYSGAPLQVLLGWFFMTLLAIGAPVALLGVALPWVLDDQDSPRGWGITYALNTFAAIAGSLGTAWLLLPAIGFARTAWLAGAVVATAGIAMTPRPRRLAWGAIGAAALLLAMRFESGVGKTRTQGRIVYATHRLLEFFEGPEATVSAVEYDNGGRALIVDGFLTAAQVGWAHYMAWMGHLPMLLHPDPENALVICFGTGQTSNAVRQEGRDRSTSSTSTRGC
jgi:spermidine synthase